MDDITKTVNVRHTETYSRDWRDTETTEEILNFTHLTKSLVPGCVQTIHTLNRGSYDYCFVKT